MAFPDVRVDVAFTAASTGAYWHIGDAARGKIGTAAVGPTDLWTDVSAWADKVTARRGSNRGEGPVLRYEAGTATIDLDNSDRRFDPTNLDGPYVTAGLTQVTPMRAARVVATHDGVTYPVWRGYADAWQITYAGTGYSKVVLTATDGFKVLAGFERLPGAAVGSGEDSGARVNRVLNSVDWPQTDRVVAAGDSTLQATTLEGAAATELYEVADAEIGELYIDGAGRVVFRNRLALLQEDRSSTPQAVFGDGDYISLPGGMGASEFGSGTFGDPGEGSGELDYDDISVEYDDEALINLAQVSRAGGVEQTADDTDSRSRYLTHTYNRADLLLETDAEALNYARFVVRQSADPELRFATITITAAEHDDHLFPHLLGREIGDRITVIRRPPGGGDPIERDVFIRGISHEVDAAWRTTWVLQSATRYAFWTIGHPTLGAIGTNAIAY